MKLIKKILNKVKILFAAWKRKRAVKKAIKKSQTESFIYD